MKDCLIVVSHYNDIYSYHLHTVFKLHVSSALRFCLPSCFTLSNFSILHPSCDSNFKNSRNSSVENLLAYQPYSNLECQIQTRTQIQTWNATVEPLLTSQVIWTPHDSKFKTVTCFQIVISFKVIELWTAPTCLTISLSPSHPYLTYSDNCILPLR